MQLPFSGIGASPHASEDSILSEAPRLIVSRKRIPGHPLRRACLQILPRISGHPRMKLSGAATENPMPAGGDAEMNFKTSGWLAFSVAMDAPAFRPVPLIVFESRELNLNVFPGLSPDREKPVPPPDLWILSAIGIEELAAGRTKEEAGWKY